MERGVPLPQTEVVQPRRKNLGFEAKELEEAGGGEEDGTGGGEEVLAC